ncbi:MAG: dockerin type I domain-containing protein [Planctomycetota bacterium]
MTFTSLLKQSAVAAAVTLLVLTGPASAQVLFQDTFDRANNDDIDADTTGMLGTLAPLTYLEGPAGDSVADGSLSNIENNALQLADGPNMSMVSLDQNFIGGMNSMSISLDLVANNGTNNAPDFFVGLGVGGTQAEAAAVGFDHNATVESPGWKGNQNGTTAGSGFADFYVAWERTGANPNSDGRIAFWKNGVRGAIFDNDGSFYNIGDTLDVDLVFDDFNAGAMVTANVSYGETFVGSDTFTWDNTDSNYIGVTGRMNNQGWTVDNLTIDTSAAVVPSLTIDRDTGNITFTNTTTAPLEIVAYSIQSDQPVFDTTQWVTLDTQDTSNTWERLTAPGDSASDLSEGTLGVTGFVVDAAGGPNDSINFGNVWVPSPFENFTAVDFRDAAGATIPVGIQVVGNGGEPLQLGDFDGSGVIDAADWAILRGNLISDPPGDGLINYAIGDVNIDGVIDRRDFNEFKNLFDAANGEGAFQAMLAGVPEPTSAALAVFAGAALAALRRARRLTACLALGALLSVAGPVEAADLLIDTFDRADSDDIDASQDGVLAGSPVTYVENGDDSLGNNAALTNISGNQLQMADGTNATTFYIDRNFIDSAITTDGVLSIKLDIAANNGGTTDQQRFVGIGVGSSLTELQGQASFDQNATAASPAVRGNINAANSGFADFWVGWTPNSGGALQVVKNGNLNRQLSDLVDNATSTEGWTQPSEADGVAAELEVQLKIADFGAGTPVAATFFYNGTRIGGDAFRWDNSGQNYIAISARQELEGITVDDLEITTTTADAFETQTLSLEVYTATGEVLLVGGLGTPTIDQYEVTSVDGGLMAGAFDGIRGDSGIPAGDGSGNGWELGGSQSDTLLSEFFLGDFGQGTTQLAQDFSASLGDIYDTGADTRDLMLEYQITNGDVQGQPITISGIAAYIDGTGDFNGDGTVDAADYTVWRDNLNGAEASLAAGSGTGDGIVDVDDFNLWKVMFGRTFAPAATAAPEPSTVTTLLGAFAFAVRRGRRFSKEES